LTIRAPGTPPIHHQGGHTLGQLFCTFQQAEALIAWLEGQGVQGEIANPPDPISQSLALPSDEAPV